MTAPGCPFPLRRVRRRPAPSDYRQVHLFHGLLKDSTPRVEAHRRGMRVITELVLAHTSDEHPWFQRARRAKPGSTHRDWYLWDEDTSTASARRGRIQGLRGRPTGCSDPRRPGHFPGHRFYGHQPSLNYDNPAVRQAMFDVVDYWLSMGVDGLRLDAVPYLYARDGTTRENLLRDLFEFQCPAAVLPTLASRTACCWPRPTSGRRTRWPTWAGDMRYGVPLSPRQVCSWWCSPRKEDCFLMVDILTETPTTPPECQWPCPYATTTIDVLRDGAGLTRSATCTGFTWPRPPGLDQRGHPPVARPAKAGFYDCLHVRCDERAFFSMPGNNHLLR